MALFQTSWWKATASRLPKSARWTIVGTCCAAAIMIGLNGSAGPTVNAETLARGRDLFEHEWKKDDPLAHGGDGLGPVFNRNSCVACHFQGGLGGAGTNRENVVAISVVPTVGRPEHVFSVIHNSSLSTECQESRECVTKKFPILPEVSKEIAPGCIVKVPQLDPVSVIPINTPALFGVGMMDQISDSAIRSNHGARSRTKILRELTGDFKGTPAGRYRVLADGRIGKFGWKSQFATVDEFVAVACAVELGLSNPQRKQDAPRQFAEDRDAALDMDSRDLFELAAFVKGLPQPEQILPEDASVREEVKTGEQLFLSIGCADCHTPKLGGVDQFYSDLLLHAVEDERTIPGYRRQERDDILVTNDPRPNEWKTPPLWGVADTAPYFHDGGAQTLEDAIERHAGESREVRENFRNLKPVQQQSVIAFLKTLKAPRSACRTNVGVIASSAP